MESLGHATDALLSYLAPRVGGGTAGHLHVFDRKRSAFRGGMSQTKGDKGSVDLGVAVVPGSQRALCCQFVAGLHVMEGNPVRTPLLSLTVGAASRILIGAERISVVFDGVVTVSVLPSPYPLGAVKCRVANLPQACLAFLHVGESSTFVPSECVGASPAYVAFQRVDQFSCNKAMAFLFHAGLSRRCIVC